MIDKPFLRFGRAGLRYARVFAWLEDREAKTVKVFSDHAGVVELEGPEAERFLLFFVAESEEVPIPAVGHSHIPTPPPVLKRPIKSSPP